MADMVSDIFLIATVISLNMTFGSTVSENSRSESLLSMSSLLLTLLAITLIGRRQDDGVTVDSNAKIDTEIQTYYSDFEMSRNYLPEHVNATVIQVPPLSQAGNPSSPTRMHGASGDSPIRVTASKVRSNEDIESTPSSFLLVFTIVFVYRSK
jgi:hypothetical protein